MVEPLYPALTADDETSGPQEVESLCVNCEDNGITKIMLTRIPHYKEVIIMSFECEHCGFANNEIQSGGRIQDQGVRFSVKMSNVRDLSRQVVKSDYATLSVPEIELEIPPLTQKGEISTVEGILQRTITGLEQDQPVRRIMEPEDAKKIDDYVGTIKELLELKREFVLTVDDPSGNSFIENPLAPAADPEMKILNYERSLEQDHILGLYKEEELKEADDPVLKKVKVDDILDEEKLKEEVLKFSTNCPDCNALCDTNMKVTQIPFFKDVVIMATNCDSCGHKTNEVKSGGGIDEKGRKITLHITDPSDMSRDVLKSETCDIHIPELDFEMGGGALGGRFTTLEGLLKSVLDQIISNPLWGGGGGTLEGGDGAAPDLAARMAVFRQQLSNLTSGEKPFTLVLDDPTGNSYLQNVYAPDEDPEMTVEYYERSFDQNENLGLNDMKVDDYEQS